VTPASDDEGEAQALAAIDADLTAAIAAWAVEMRGRPGLGHGAEAIRLRGLLAQPSTVPKGVLLQAWRTLNAGRDGVARIALWGGRDPVAVTDLARRRFGFAAALQPAATPEDALATARAPGVVAVLALDERTPWWARLLAEPRLRVFGLLPEVSVQGPCVALAVGEVAVEPTGGDETLWVTDAAGSAEAIEDGLGRAGFSGRLIVTAGGLKLFALAGYVQREDRRLLAAPGRLSGVIGASPIPYDA
jgi:hypothetical protein